MECNSGSNRASDFKSAERVKAAKIIQLWHFICTSLPCDLFLVFFSCVILSMTVSNDLRMNSTEEKAILSLSSTQEDYIKQP